MNSLISFIQLILVLARSVLFAQKRTNPHLPLAAQFLISIPFFLPPPLPSFGILFLTPWLVHDGNLSLKFNCIGLGLGLHYT